MKRIRTSTAAVALPALSNTGTEGYFTPGDPGTGTPATHLDAAFCNAVQEEIRAVIVEVGALTPSGTDLGQMAEAVHGSRALRANETGAATQVTNATTTADKALIAATSSYANGSGNNLAAACTAGQALGSKTFVGASATCVINGNAVESAVIAADDVNIIGAGSDNCFGAASTACDIQGGAAKSAVLASTGCTVESGLTLVAACDALTTSTGFEAVALASAGGHLDGTRAVLAATEDCGADGTLVLTAASYDAETDGDMSASIACNATNIGTTRDNAVLAASKNAELGTSFCLALGYHATVKPAFADADQNLTIKLEGTAGNGTCDGAWTGGGADFAELFELAEPGTVLQAGSLVTRVGRRVRVAQPGDRILGVVSAAPALLGGAGVSWAGRYERDEFGAAILETLDFVRWPALYEPMQGEDGQDQCDGPMPGPARRVLVRAAYDGLVAGAPGPIPEGARFYSVTAPKPSASYDPSKPFIPRTERRDEWCPVALVGQVRVRVAGGVQVDDLLAPGAGGVAVSLAKGNPKGASIEVMEITAPFDAARGYGVALCLVR